MKFKPLNPSDVTRIVVHHSATPADADIGAAEIDLMHRQRGWLAIGYHLVITRDGSIQHGRDVTDQGAHVKGFNNSSIGICMVGGLGKDGESAVDNFTGAQYEALRWQLGVLELAFPYADVVRHKDLANTLCSEVRLPE